MDFSFYLWCAHFVFWSRDVDNLAFKSNSHVSGKLLLMFPFRVKFYLLSYAFTLNYSKSYVAYYE